MNERIREISRQTVISMRAEKTDLPPLEENVIQKILELREEYDKRFAELIVRECMAKVHQEIDTDYCEISHSILNERVMKHFGVE